VPSLLRDDRPWQSVVDDVTVKIVQKARRTDSGKSTVLDVSNDVQLLAVVEAHKTAATL